MKKVFLLSLIIVLLSALVVPAAVAPAPVSAWSGTVTCSVSELNFRVYAGVPTYLLGFIPLEDGQTLTLTHEGGFLESAGWTVSDTAGWLNEDPLLGVVGCLDRDQDVTVRVNTDGMTAGTYTATITFKFTTCATTKITIPVTVNVIEPAVLGPLGIGLDKEIFKNIVGKPIFEEENKYTGLVANLLTNPDNMMDMQAIETDGCFDMVFQCGEEIPDMGIPINGGTLTINGNEQQIAGGIIAGIGTLIAMMGGSGSLPIPADFDWGDNYVALFSLNDANYTAYTAIIISDINALLPLLDSLGGLFSTGSGTEPDLSAPPDEGTGGGSSGSISSEDLTIPLGPILNILPSLMPVLSNMLSNDSLMAILSPILDMLPPIVVVMDFNTMMTLFMGMGTPS